MPEAIAEIQAAIARQTVASFARTCSFECLTSPKQATCRHIGEFGFRQRDASDGRA